MEYMIAVWIDVILQSMNSCKKQAYPYKDGQLEDAKRAARHRRHVKKNQLLSRRSHQDC